MKEIAVFDLDGTLIGLGIDRRNYERRRSFWAAYLTTRGVPTTLKPIWPELQRISHTPLGSTIRADILKDLDELEVTGQYSCLGRIRAVLSAARSHFRKLVLVTHNGLAFWNRLAHEHSWPHLFDMVFTRDDMFFFKPDLQACEKLLPEFAALPQGSECWVIGNDRVDRGLGINLRQTYSHLTVRTFLIDPSCQAGTRSTQQLDVDVRSIDVLSDLMRHG